jgi:hypothetical protein
MNIPHDVTAVVYLHYHQRFKAAKPKVGLISNNRHSVKLKNNTFFDVREQVLNFPSKPKHARLHNLLPIHKLRDKLGNGYNREGLIDAEKGQYIHQEQ